MGFAQPTKPATGTSCVKIQLVSHHPIWLVWVQNYQRGILSGHPNPAVLIEGLTMMESSVSFFLSLSPPTSSPTSSKWMCQWSKQAELGDSLVQEENSVLKLIAFDLFVYLSILQLGEGEKGCASP